MNRRDFMKFFSATAATAASATALAKIPAAAPRIELLEPRDLVTLERPPRLITSITEIKVSEEGNYNGYLPGQRIKTVEASFYTNSVDRGRYVMGREVRADAFPYVDEVVSFDIRQLAGEKYVVTEYTVEAAADTLALATVTAIKVA